jgi:serine kinase of HPr protein (carbohydrate metabolism regulator)
MSAAPANIHGTAIVVGKTGIVFLGPSGSGKSSLAFSCLAEARSLSLSAALVADDRVLVSERDGEVLAACPPSIAGLIEVRGTGILHLPHVSPTVVQLAVMPVDLATAPRLPEEDERIEVAPGIMLPLVRIAATARHPLAIIMAKMPGSFD